VSVLVSGRGCNSATGAFRKSASYATRGGSLPSLTLLSGAAKPLIIMVTEGRGRHAMALAMIYPEPEKGGRGHKRVDVSSTVFSAKRTAARPHCAARGARPRRPRFERIRSKPKGRSTAGRPKRIGSHRRQCIIALWRRFCSLNAAAHGQDSPIADPLPALPLSNLVLARR
jgi:hypothetical protein